MNQDGNGNLEMTPINLEHFRVPSDDVMMTTITCTAEGRIFLGGNDGHLYELEYRNHNSWLKGRCNKVSQTKSSEFVYAQYYLAHLSSTIAHTRPAGPSAALGAASTAGFACIALLQIDWCCIARRCAILEDLRPTCLAGLSSAAQAQSCRLSSTVTGRFCIPGPSQAL